MNNTNCNDSLLSELDPQEMIEVKGGNLLFLAVGGYLLYEIAGNPIASWEAFKRGYHALD